MNLFTLVNLDIHTCEQVLATCRVNSNAATTVLFSPDDNTFTWDKVGVDNGIMSTFAEIFIIRH